MYRTSRNNFLSGGGFTFCCKRLQQLSFPLVRDRQSHGHLGNRGHRAEAGIGGAEQARNDLSRGRPAPLAWPAVLPYTRFAPIRAEQETGRAWP